MEIAVVEWVDACINDAYRPMQKDDNELRITHGVSVGHVVKETNEMISLAGDRFDIETWPYRKCSSIPKACITRIQRIQVEVNIGG